MTENPYKNTMFDLLALRSSLEAQTDVRSAERTCLVKRLETLDAEYDAYRSAFGAVTSLIQWLTKLGEPVEKDEQEPIVPF